MNGWLEGSSSEKSATTADVRTAFPLVPVDHAALASPPSDAVQALWVSWVRRAVLGCAVLGCAGLGWAGLGWAGLGWAGLGWAGLCQGVGSCTVWSPCVAV